MTSISRGLILLTGVTGYVGGRLLPLLESQSYQVRCLVRDPKRVEGRVSENTEVCTGDVLSGEGLQEALQDVDCAYYLIHSMGSSEDFEEQDRIGARNFALAAQKAGVKKIIYLGALGEETQKLSPHLKSRQEVGRILASTGVPVLEFRASVVIGSGSLSFEMIRALVNRLPVMITPRWVSCPAQPIGIEDLLDYLLEGLEYPAKGHEIFEIGGSEKLSYRGMMEEYARQVGLKRYIIPVPVLSPRLSSLWLGLFTPLFARIGRKLIDSIRHSTVVRNPSALQVFKVRPIGASEAIRRALEKEEQEFVKTHWAGALSSASSLKASWEGVRFQKRIVDRRSIHVPVSAEKAFEPIRRIGGRSGWYYANTLWKLRGLLDLLVGGVGMWRGRRDPCFVHVGDTIDCWRVDAVDSPRRLLLTAEMRLPGRAWLEFTVEPDQSGSWIHQTAIYDPVGLFGLFYWYALLPVHTLVFRGMLRGIAQRATGTTKSSLPPILQKGIALLISILICFSAAGFGAWASGSSVGTWYQTILKPNWTPPDWIFGPVWTLLYLMMAVSAWLVWIKKKSVSVFFPLSLFFIQLVLNSLWSLFFFGWQSPGLAFLDITLLWVFIVLTMLGFLPVSYPAGILLVPYLLWVSFALLLNLEIWRLNG